MRKARKLCALACGGWLAAAGCAALDAFDGEESAGPAAAAAPAPSVPPPPGPVLPAPVAAASASAPNLPAAEPENTPLPINPPVSDGFGMFAQRLLDAGFTVDEIRTMAVTNPTRLLGA